MFALIDVRATGLSGEAFAHGLLEATGRRGDAGRELRRQPRGLAAAVADRARPPLAEAAARIAAFATDLRPRKIA